MRLTNLFNSLKKKVNGSLPNKPNTRPLPRGLIPSGSNNCRAQRHPCQVEYFRAHFGSAESRWKKDGTRVTIVDETISRELFSLLHKEFPEDDYCSEEGAETAIPVATNAEFCWILDPVDGTNNYAVGVPECCISLGLLRHGIPVYGFIYDYGRDNLLQGGKEFGAIEGTDSVLAPLN